MADPVACAECGVRYDPDLNTFCPRCGSTARGPPVPVPAMAAAQRNAPGRVRVRVSGAILAVIGGLFLLTSLISLAASPDEFGEGFAAILADQAGGTVVFVPASEAPFDLVLRDLDGGLINETTGHVGELRVRLSQHAAATYEANLTDGVANGTVLVSQGDTLRVRLAAGDVEEFHSSSSVDTAIGAGRYVLAACALLLFAGGVAALLLRWWPLAAVAAVFGLVLALLVLVVFVWAGLLFALPFGLSAYFILRGRKHFGKVVAREPPMT